MTKSNRLSNIIQKGWWSITDTVLIISSTKNSFESFESLLKAHDFVSIKKASSGSEARRMLIDNDFDLVIINSPLSDEFGHELALYLSDNFSAGIILIVKSDISDQVSSKVEDYGVYVLEKPLNKQMFYQSIKLINASQKKLMGLRKENSKLQVKIEEIKLVDRAKCTLIQYLKFTESQAHRYIEKQAMDMRKTRY